jgi:signal transduction histidine kinase
MEQGSEGGELCRLDLGAEVSTICAETYARDTHLRVRTEGDVFVCADRDLLTRLLCNLIGNAIKYSDPPEHAVVTVTVERGEREALLSVSDRGIGIPPEAHERIWQRFTRLDIARADGESTGLGLAIVRGIAERFGGYMTLESEVGVGSTFTLHLPLL